jgi:transcriptional regulator with XRE-family HTH domain
MQPSGDDARAELARRLRELRKDFGLTQAALAAALSDRESTSVASISSWESQQSPKLPTEDRLELYATFFATRRSIAGGGARLLGAGELTEEERRSREDLRHELAALRAAAVHEPVAEVIGARGPWYFADERPVTIVCAPVPPELLAQMPYTQPDAPDYIQLYTYADVDALLELHGHLRAANPAVQVNIRLASELASDDYVTHLVLLGGVDWNVLTRDVLERFDLPLTQVSSDADPEGAHFQVHEGGSSRAFRPVLRTRGRRTILAEDVAHFFRAPNPFNRKRTITICNGIYGRGTYGAVRTLTDSRFRDRNAEYLESRFRGGDTFSILARVPIVNGVVVTPDWTQQETRLHEWPEAAA